MAEYRLAKSLTVGVVMCGRLATSHLASWNSLQVRQLAFERTQAAARFRFCKLGALGLGTRCAHGSLDQFLCAVEGHLHAHKIWLSACVRQGHGAAHRG